MSSTLDASDISSPVKKGIYFLFIVGGIVKKGKSFYRVVVATEASEPTRRRRHGRQLESELLSAAWGELVEVGYARLTMGSVAARARTSEPVLYRRWSNKDQLVLAALDHHRDTNPVAVPDTGTVRSDLLAYLTAVSESLAGFFAIAAAVAFSGLLADTGLSPSQVRDRAMDTPRLPRVRIVYQRAHDRGELDLDQVPSALLAMPFDLVRHDLLMDLRPLPPARILSIVDELFLPLLRNYRPDQPCRSAPSPGSSDPATS